MPERDPIELGVCDEALRLSSPSPANKPRNMDAAIIALGIMLCMHGFFLDIIIIGILPFLSESAGDASRAALFPWCLGGYAGFGSDKVPNLAPTHRRFIAENAAYAVLRGGAGLYVFLAPALAMPALVLAVVSHFIEAVTIAWELFSHGAPKDSAPPMTLMGIFASWTLATVMFNTDYFVVDAASLLVIQVFVGLTWAAWMCGVVGIKMQASKGTQMS